MKIISASHKIEDEIAPDEIIKKIESFGRVCYKSEANVTPQSAGAFIRRIIKNGHESVIEHVKLSVRFICDRGVSHEIVRHRIASYSQESTRYCNYAGERFGNELTFIKPCFWNETDEAYKIWEKQMAAAEQTYFQLLETGAKPEQARSVLPNSIKTEMIATMNLREWRHFMKMRTDAAAHPQMRELTIPLLNEFKSLLSDIFYDIEVCT